MEHKIHLVLIFVAGKNDIVYGGGVWVAIGFDSSTNNSATVWTSSNNGVAWTKVTLPSSALWAYQIWYVNGNFIVADYQAYIYVSTDGITWTRKTGARDLGIGAISNAGNKIKSVNYVNSIYFFGTLNGTITSTDLTTYTAAYTINNCNGSTVYFGYIQYSAINSTWYAFASVAGVSANSETYPTMWTSSDGITGLGIPLYIVPMFDGWLCTNSICGIKKRNKCKYLDWLC